MGGAQVTATRSPVFCRLWIADRQILCYASPCWKKQLIACRPQSPTKEDKNRDEDADSDPLKSTIHGASYSDLISDVAISLALCARECRFIMMSLNRLPAIDPSRRATSAAIQAS